MNCLENLIGLSDCVDSTAPFLINDIGIDANQMRELMDASYANVDAFFTANRRTASRLLESDLYGRVPSQMKSQSVLEGNTVGMYPDQRKQFSGSGISGIKHRVYNDSNFLKIRIKEIRLFTDHDGDVDVKIYNVTTGQEVGSVTVACEAGKIASTQCDVEVQSLRQDLDIFIGYDVAGITSYNAGNYGKFCCGNSFRSGWCTFQSATIESPFTSSEIKGANYSPGLTYDYEIVCDNLQWFCTHRSLFGMAMAYKTAISILENAMDSGGQFSNQKTTNYEKNANRLETFTAHYNDQISKSLRSVRFPRNQCFQCNTITEVTNRLPG
ncbi:MAG: hypothetical protein LC664_12895 [Flavobacteriales bacterium]|nr:hypothetical protein [Flavobacteriales bacterium]